MSAIDEVLSLVGDDRDPSETPASRASQVEAARRLRTIADILGVPIERFFEPSGGQADDDPRRPSTPNPKEGDE